MKGPRFRLRINAATARASPSRSIASIAFERRLASAWTSALTRTGATASGSSYAARAFVAAWRTDASLSNSAPINATWAPSAGAVKLGHPVPDSYLVSERNSGWPQHTQR